MRGLAAALRAEAAFRQELLLCALLLPLSFWLAQSVSQWLWLVTPLLILLIVELLHSAVETAIDRIGPERHELSGRAKDLGSAAVMLSLLLLAVSWGAVLWERFHG
ncbi:MAG: diacylglycerol kinase [Gammaproteobacteria bacterium]